MKFKSFLTAHKALIKDIVTSTCLVGASAGIVFGISAATFKIQYMKLEGAKQRLAAYKSHNYLSEKISSAWNMNEGKTADGKVIPAVEAPIWKDMKGAPQEAITWWKKIHPTGEKHLWDRYDILQMDKNIGDPSYSAFKNRYTYASMVIDGATHTTMDRSFNQSLYQGLVDFVHNEPCDHCDAETGNDPEKQFIAKSYKPSQDNTTDFINTYATVIKQHDVVGLAGFNHSTPLTTMMTHADDGKGKVKPIVNNTDPAIDRLCNETGFILLDSNIANNQNVASVQFRADQPGFLAGLATCQYFYDNLDLYHNKFQPLAVGAYGGVAIPTVVIYIGGFQRGIELFNYEVLDGSLVHGAYNYFNEISPTEDFRLTRFNTFKKLIKYSKYKDEIDKIKNDQSLTGAQKEAKFRKNIYEKMYDEFSVKMIRLGDFDTNFSGTFAAGDAIGITKQFLNRGAGAIIAVAGPQSLDSAQEIQNQNSKCIVIGVDTAMEDGDYQRYHKGCNESTKTKANLKDPYVDKTVAPDGSRPEQANAIIKFSAVKDIKTVSNKIVRLCAEGKNWDICENGDETKPDPLRSICGPGFQTCGNIQNGLISISWDGFYQVLKVLEHICYYIHEFEYSLQDAWNICAENYLASLPTSVLDTIPDEYKVGIHEISKCYTFNRKKRNGEPTVYFENYNHTMGILGGLLSISYVDFTRDMTLVPDGYGEYVIPISDSNKLAITDWLDYNMYMMS